MSKATKAGITAQVQRIESQLRTKQLERSKIDTRLRLLDQQAQRAIAPLDQEIQRLETEHARATTAGPGGLTKRQQADLLRDVRDELKSKRQERQELLEEFQAQADAEKPGAQALDKAILELQADRSWLERQLKFAA